MRTIFAAATLAAILLLGTGAVSRADAPSVPAAPPAAAAPTAVVADDKTDLPTKPAIVEVIKITGEIGDDTVDSVVEAVKKINDTPRIKGVLLSLDSPGGGVIASDQVFHELAKIKVPVVAWCDSECASGAMYISMAPSVKFIAVREMAISGSIGVRMSVKGYSRLLDWAKIDATTYKSGSLKDAGGGDHVVSAEETAYLQGIVDRLAKRFYGLVADARGDKITDWARIKRAEIFFGHEGVDAGLIDAVMTREDAIKKVKALSGVTTPIYTREEMKEMSRSADVSETAPDLQPRASGLDIPGLAQKYERVIDEVLNGSSITAEYMMPYRF